jgi:hypothetical protein
MAWTVPRTWVTGELVSSSMFNTNVRDNSNFLFTNFSVWAQVPFNAANFTGDSGGWTVHAGNVTANFFEVVNQTLYWIFAVSATTLVAQATFLEIVSPVLGAYHLTGSASQAKRVSILGDAGGQYACVTGPLNSTTMGVWRVDGQFFQPNGASLSLWFNTFCQVLAT